MLGNVFSPYYAAARKRHPTGADPLAFSTMNVAVYGRGGSLWSLTERPRAHVTRSARELSIGASCMRWEGGAIVVDLAEVTAPFGGAITGRVRVHPAHENAQSILLSERGEHRWVPIAPHARAEVELSRPGLRWSGAAYFDHNRGDGPLEESFTGWSWARASMKDKTFIGYDVQRRDGTELTVGRAIDGQGRAEVVEGLSRCELARTGWRLPRSIALKNGASARVTRGLEDTPFYARSLVDVTMERESVRAVHEVLDLDRFASSWVQRLIPFRMRRAP
jgi:carotenoid 1,2-hydratase